MSKDVEGRIEELTQRLNDRSSKLTIWLEDLAALVQIIKKNGGITSLELNEPRDSVLNHVRDAIQPFIKLVGRLSSMKDDPGGLLIKWVIHLERSVVEIRASKVDSKSFGKTVAGREPPAPRPSLSWSLGTEPVAVPTGGGYANTGGQDTREMQHMIRVLEQRITDLETQLGGESIVVAGSEFKSITGAGAWLKANAPMEGDYAYFLDAHGLMALAYGRGASTVQVLLRWTSKRKI
jgi:hypothetical protein